MKATVLEQKANLALLGIRPTYPSAKYGYILTENGNISEEKIYKVSSFEEKPSEARAQELMVS